MREELSEATFRPSINTRNEYEGHGQSVADRNRAWNENKLKKIEALKLQSEQELSGGLLECTFRPKINKCFSSAMVMNRKKSIEQIE